MDRKDFEITIVDGKITRIEHSVFDTCMSIVSEFHKQKILAEIFDFTGGHSSELRIWSDNDYEEPSTRVYFIISNKTGSVILINELEELIFPLHSIRDLYMCDVEDNLF